MLKSKKVAVTGGISSGKSLFCAFFKEFGAYVVSADSIVHQLLSPHNDPGKKVIKLLGLEIVENGLIDRKKIADKVFKDTELLRSLELIIHPEVFREINKEYKKSCEQNFLLFIAEVPLLFETGAQKFFDKTIAVLSNEQECESRFVKITGKEQKEFKLRAQQQLTLKEKATMADYVVMNDGSKQDLKNEAERMYKILTDCSIIN